MNEYMTRPGAPRHRTIERDALVRVAERLKAEHDALLARCATAIKGEQDYDNLWAEAKGVFFAYRNVADLLGWQ